MKTILLVPPHFVLEPVPDVAMYDDLHGPVPWHVVKWEYS